MPPTATKRLTPYRGRSCTSIQCVNTGSDYSDDELEFLRAIDRYKVENRRPHPTWSEVLGVLRSLGYRK